MLQILNKFRRDQARTILNSQSGQVAVILILVIAVALIFYAVSLNLGWFVIPRTLVTMASNGAASLLASNMASYGQSLSETQLRGGRKVCAWTGVMAAIIALVLIVIIIVVSIFTAGGAAAASAGFWASIAANITAGQVVAIVAAVAAVGLQMAVVQPGITDSWNSMLMSFLSQRNQFTEGAIQTALGRAVTDPIQVPDFSDSDRDLIWVSSTDPNPDPPFADSISRYAVYYSWRLEQIKGSAEAEDVRDFIDALRELLYQGGDNWGLYDPMPSEFCQGMAECHPCCTPAEANLTIGGVIEAVAIRAAMGSCDPTVDWETLCTIASPYQDGGGVAAYPYLFDLYFENPFDAFVSFREQLGRDDETKNYYKNSEDPSSLPKSGGRDPQTPLLGDGFRLEDTTGYYPADNLEGIFPFFYKMRDWGVDLLTVQQKIEGGTMLADNRECHWCDPAWDPDCPSCDMAGIHPHPTGEIPQLVLPRDPATLTYEPSSVVDGAGNAWDAAHKFPQPWPPTAVDRVTLPGNIIAADDVCAEDAIYHPSASDTGFWKAGADRFCTDEAPYFLECAKGENCAAGNPGDFPDDTLDNIIYGLPDFYEWAQKILSKAADMMTFSEEFIDWYPEAAVWVEPGSPPGVYDTEAELPCYYCEDLALEDGSPIAEGYLWVWLKEMIGVRDRILGWINNHNAATETDEGYGGAACTDVWCVPISGPGDTCPDLPVDEGEYATFDTNNDDVIGDVEDIVGCLNYNVNGYDHVAAEAFKNCRDSLGCTACTVGADLPEFHLDGVTPYEYPDAAAPCTEWQEAMDRNIAGAVNPPEITPGVPFRWGNDYRFKACAETCSLAACHRLPRSLLPYAADAEYWPNGTVDDDPFHPGYQPLDPATADGDWLDLTAFDDCLERCSPQNCTVGSRLPTQSTAGGVNFTYPSNTIGAAADCAAWGAGNAWYDDIVDNKNALLSARTVDGWSQQDREEELAVMLSCFWNCGAGNPDCAASLALPGPPGVGYTWPGGPVQCDAAGRPSKPGWNDAFVNNVIAAGGESCDLSNYADPDIVDGWLYSTMQSSLEAENQVAKFEQRRNFLQERLDEARDILDILGEEDPDLSDEVDEGFGFIGKMDSFLRGPAADLIRARIDWKENGEDEGLPYQAVYGWRDESTYEDDGQTEIPGRWHLVKVEARVPGMCDDACGIDQTSEDPAWPKVTTRTKSWGTKRCYELRNTEGLVKFRTTRWDQDKRTGPGLKFPNGTPIWSFRSNNPLRPLDPKYKPAHLDAADICGSATLDHILGTDIGTDAYKGAILMNERTPENAACWDLAHGLLSTGVMNETCAQYYWHEGTNRGMGMKFVRCKNF